MIITDHQAKRMAQIMIDHSHLMDDDPAHAVVCRLEPCSIAMLLKIVCVQTRALHDVAGVAKTCLEQAEPYLAVDKRQTVNALETGRSLVLLGRTLSGIVSEPPKASV